MKSLSQQIFIAMVAAIVVGIGLNQLGESLPLIANANEWLLSVFHTFGKIFINALKMLVIPLVVCSLISGILEIGDIQQLGRVGGKSLLYYLGTTAIAITIALLIAHLFQAVFWGDKLGAATEALTFTAKESPPLSEVFIGLVPSNFIQSAAQGNMLPVIVFTILLGISMVHAGEKGRAFGQVFLNCNAVMMSMVTLVMKFAPIGIFCLLAKTLLSEGLDTLRSMLDYFVTVALCLIIHAMITYPTLLKVFSGLSIRPFLTKMRNAQLFAFSTASSNATIPITLRTAEYRLGADNGIASFTVPFGATINMDGTSIMQGVATVFIAHVYGIDLSLMDCLTVVFTAVLASIGTAGVPGVGLIMLSMVLTQVGLPVEGIGLIIGVDRLLDMMRTAVNVTGDAAVTCVIAHQENALDKSIYYDERAGEEEDK